jgi:hypothetical protein
MLHRPLASEFLSLLQVLEVSKEETRMADNYFSVLRNHPLGTWFDQGIELGSGQAFTVGSEGHERNKHIVSLKAASMALKLNVIVSCPGHANDVCRLPSKSLDSPRWLDKRS